MFEIVPRLSRIFGTRNVALRREGKANFGVSIDVRVALALVQILDLLQAFHHMHLRGNMAFLTRLVALTLAAGSVALAQLADVSL